jgi:hypothetical protein
MLSIIWQCWPRPAFCWWYLVHAPGLDTILHCIQGASALDLAVVALWALPAGSMPVAPVARANIMPYSPLFVRCCQKGLQPNVIQQRVNIQASIYARCCRKCPSLGMTRHCNKNVSMQARHPWNGPKLGKTHWISSAFLGLCYYLLTYFL